MSNKTVLEMRELPQHVYSLILDVAANKLIAGIAPTHLPRPIFSCGALKSSPLTQWFAADCTQTKLHHRTNNNIIHQYSGKHFWIYIYIYISHSRSRQLARSMSFRVIYYCSVRCVLNNSFSRWTQRLRCMCPSKWIYGMRRTTKDASTTSKIDQHYTTPAKRRIKKNEQPLVAIRQQN